MKSKASNSSAADHHASNMRKEGTTATLAIVLTLLNLHRYNLPARVFLGSVFDMLNVYCWLFALAALYFYEERPAIRSIYFFGLLGVFNALLNETFFVPTLPAWSENLMMIGAAVLSLTHYLYLRWKKKKSLKT